VTWGFLRWRCGISREREKFAEAKAGALRLRMLRRKLRRVLMRISFQAKTEITIGANVTARV